MALADSHNRQEKAARVQRVFDESMAALPPAQAYWVALSGGLDSMVLANLAKQRWPNLRLLHINHGLSPQACAWQQTVETWAQANQLTCKSVVVSVDKTTASLELAARNARYAVFAATLAEGEALLCAHHLNDQAETLLLRLMRGSGLKGLTAMAPSRALGAGMVQRPLLGLTRAELHAYAEATALPWVDDESNQDLRFDRNWVRKNLLPSLSQRWPQAAQCLAQTSLRLQQEQNLLDTYLAADLATCAPRNERLGHSLALTPLNTGSTGSAERRRSLLRFWFNQLGLLAPSRAVLNQMEQLIHSRVDSQGCVAWGQNQLRRFAGRLYVLPQFAPMPAGWQAQWDAQTLLTMPNGSAITAKGWPPGQYSLRLRQGGERSHPAGRAHSQTLKKLLQEAALAPWLRDEIPLIFNQSGLVAVGDLWVERGFKLEGDPRVEWCFG